MQGFLCGSLKTLIGPVAKLRLSRLVAPVACGGILAAAFLVSCGNATRAAYPPNADPDSAFAVDVVPMLELRCEGCHFPGGDQYASMPFDDARVILRLGDQMLSQLEGEDRILIADFIRLAVGREEP